MDIREHYRQRLELFGDTAEAAQYSDRETQEKRFAILTDIAPLNGSRILDFGSGTGHLATYLKNRNIDVEYTGVDIVPELLACGREKHPEHRFELWENLGDETFDYAFVSGVFNNRTTNNRAFYQNTVSQLFSRVQRGLAFNLMSTYVDYQDEELFYETPEDAFSYVKQLTPTVTLRHDYQIKDNVIPFEYAIYAYKQP
ncbi:class I SAM-dependent methyltransferase [Endozoicomonas arenosclerae]|uniref:class I SAM-dependent methyltransferase n=1 Tax=Endozoicomonas arenosclerae TaxID=1633495 RepID=UPI0007818B30|nr:class I SAM-dependent methyltransferase [Endozoicomonas arenosclerae]